MNTEDKRLTITIPSYNSEKFIKKILNSVTSVNNIEHLDIIVVDDGSNDNTSFVASEFSNRWPNSVRVISKENGGHGSAINTGIKFARGRYFKVVDSDDWLDPKNLERFVELLDKEDVDLLFTPFWIVNAKNGKTRIRNVRPQRVLPEKEYLIDSGKLLKIPSMHSYTIKTSLLTQNDIFIDEHAFYVDVEYILFPIPFVRTFKFIDLPLYYYQVNQANQSISISGMKRNVKQHYFVLTNLVKFLNLHSADISTAKQNILKYRISKMLAAQLKIESLFPITRKQIINSRNLFNEVNETNWFDMHAVNLPIRILIISNFKMLPIVHYLALIKMRLTYVS